MQWTVERALSEEDSCVRAALCSLFVPFPVRCRPQMSTLPYPVTNNLDGGALAALIALLLRSLTRRKHER